MENSVQWFKESSSKQYISMEIDGMVDWMFFLFSRKKEAEFSVFLWMQPVWVLKDNLPFRHVPTFIFMKDCIYSICVKDVWLWHISGSYFCQMHTFGPAEFQNNVSPIIVATDVYAHSWPFFNLDFIIKFILLHEHYEETVSYKIPLVIKYSLRV